MPTKRKIKASAKPKKLNLPNDEPVKIDMPFEDAVKKALNTPVKNSKINKK